MKSFRIVASLVFLLAATTAFAQSDSQKTFDHLKSLTGNWQGKASNGNTMKVVFRPTSGGSALLSEIMGEEDMITMFHVDNDRVLMTHYCGAGNQPRMQAKMSPDGKTITFTFVDATNLTIPGAGHMDHLVITMPDPDHHTEDWTFVNGGKEMKEHFDLARAKASM
ncbi:MAG: hypothetical protein WA628_04305 [Terriglobales bacterium]